MANYRNDKMSDIVAVTKALADENRIRILMSMTDRPLCVCRIIMLLELAPSTVSKHLSILKNAGLIVSHKDGRWIHYQLNNKGAGHIRQAISWLDRSLADDTRIAEDKRKLKKIMKIDPEKLCQMTLKK